VRLTRPEPNRPFRCVAVSPNKGLIATGESSSREADNLVIWDATTLEPVRILPGHPTIPRRPNGQPYPPPLPKGLHKLAGINGITFSPDGKLLATAADDYRARIWDVDTGELKHELIEHDLHAIQVAFSPDSKILATAGHDKTVKLWDVGTGSLMATLPYGGQAITSLALAFSPDGKTLATSDERGVSLWNMPTREQIAVLADPQGPVVSVAFADNGTLIASKWGGRIYYWRTTRQPHSAD